MSLSLARWDFNGSSEGWWLIRELPGVFLFSLPGGWAVDNDPAMLEGFESRTDALWGRDWICHALGASRNQIFKTRSQALMALEVENISVSSSLGDALC